MLYFRIPREKKEKIKEESLVLGAIGGKKVKEKGQ